MILVIYVKSRNDLDFVAPTIDEIHSTLSAEEGLGFCLPRTHSFYLMPRAVFYSRIKARALLFSKNRDPYRLCVAFEPRVSANLHIIAANRGRTSGRIRLDIETFEEWKDLTSAMDVKNLEEVRDRDSALEALEASLRAIGSLMVSKKKK